MDGQLGEITLDSSPADIVNFLLRKTSSSAVVIPCHFEGNRCKISSSLASAKFRPPDLENFNQLALQQ
ncbi:MAG: hypothetical protein C4519_21680 [Desulfobacteraceae bacterium]|nr:MAG: hypothetical protein C4519_21680 [Desulfobacteraceae bacterium]